MSEDGVPVVSDHPSNPPLPTPSSREYELWNAAEEVTVRWALIIATEGQTGVCGLDAAMATLVKACLAYEPEEFNLSAPP